LWGYKLIGLDQNDMQAAVSEIIHDRTCRISFSRQSENAKYISLNLELIVESESHRRALYDALRAHQAIKVVL
jgi:putative lipoic acid-binding regulatory protein